MYIDVYKVCGRRGVTSNACDSSYILNVELSGNSKKMKTCTKTIGENHFLRQITGTFLGIFSSCKYFLGKQLLSLFPTQNYSMSSAYI